MRAGIERAALLAVWVLVLAPGQGLAQSAQPPRPVAKNVYRLPYVDGTSVDVLQDHDSHRPTVNRYDLAGQDGNGSYTIAAAAAGQVVCVDDTNTWWCPSAVCPAGAVNCCQRNVGNACQVNCVNNFLWIRHANGEYSKYSHFQTGSVLVSPGDIVAAGAPLGLEGQIGIASGPHVHFEVAEVNQPNFDIASPMTDAETNMCQGSGFFPGDGIEDDIFFEDPLPAPTGDGANDPDDDANRQNRIVHFCDIGFLDKDDVFTANPCEQACAGSTVPSGTVDTGESEFHIALLIDTNPGGYVIEPFAGAAFQAVTRITLAPGFHAQGDSRFSATIAGCDEFGAN